MGGELIGRVRAAVRRDTGRASHAAPGIEVSQIVVYDDELSDLNRVSRCHGVAIVRQGSAWEQQSGFACDQLRFPSCEYVGGNV